MSDLTGAQWREIENASRNFVVQDSQSVHPHTVWGIELGKLRTIIKKSRRTSSQNATLWMIYQQIIETGGEDMQGFTKDDLHEFFLIDHFGGEAHELFGRKRLKPHRRSSRLTKGEFADFLDHIVRFMAERGVVLAMPGDLAA
jgi:hypothetical protein